MTLLKKAKKRTRSQDCLDPSEYENSKYGKYASRISRKTYTDICVLRNPSRTNQAYAYARNKKSGVVKDFYTKFYNRNASKQKFKNLWKFGQQIGQIRSTYMRKIKSKHEKEQAYGVMMYIMDVFGTRVGSLAHKKRYGTIGTSTLGPSHILNSHDQCILFRYPGKLFRKTKKMVETGKICDPIIIKTIQKLMSGNNYFQKDKARKMNFSDMLPRGLTAKYFRTWRANVLFVKHALKLTQNNSTKTTTKPLRRWKIVSLSIEHVSEVLHHSYQACKKSYLHPGVREWVERNGLEDLDMKFKNFKSNPYGFDNEAEIVLMKILDEQYV